MKLETKKRAVWSKYRALLLELLQYKCVHPQCAAEMAEMALLGPPVRPGYHRIPTDVLDSMSPMSILPPKFERTEEYYVQLAVLHAMGVNEGATIDQLRSGLRYWETSKRNIAELKANQQENHDN